jgi:GNAT superfamily N-acetyltransferase
MLYVPKAHRADVLALDANTAAAFATYIRHQGPKAVSAERNEPDATVPESNDIPPTAAAHTPLTDFSILKATPTPTNLPWDLPAKNTTATNGKIPIDFLTGPSDGIRWMTPLLLPAVHRKSPAREVVNVVMQLPSEVPCQSDPAVRVARESDIPILNRWRRQYKEERGILFDADLDAWVQTQRVFVYEHDKQVVAVAKFDLELPRLIEIGGVYTFPEHRTKGFGAKIVADLACRVRAAGKTPMLQVDEQNASALRIYTAMGWRPMGKLARVWLTG